MSREDVVLNLEDDELNVISRRIEGDRAFIAIFKEGPARPLFYLF